MSHEDAIPEAKFLFGMLGHMFHHNLTEYQVGIAVGAYEIAHNTYNHYNTL